MALTDKRLSRPDERMKLRKYLGAYLAVQETSIKETLEVTEI